MGLSIAEQLLLLIYRPDGSVGGPGTKLDVLVKLDVALAGALLAELARDSYVEFAEKKVRVTSRENQPAHPRLRAALAIVAKKPRNPETTLRTLAKNLRKKIRTDLVESGVMTSQSRRRRLPRYELVEPAIRDPLNQRLRAMIFDGTRPDRDTLTLVPVIATTGLANRILVDEDADTVQKRLNELTEKDWLAEGLKRAITAAKIQAGVEVVMQIVVPVIAAVIK